MGDPTLGSTAPFHEGEVTVQERAGARVAAERSARMVAAEIPVGALDFPARQSTAVLATVDPAGQVWASLGAGEPGFVRAVDPGHVEIDTSVGTLAPADPVWSGIYPGAPLGMLFLELETRRRLRVNGRVERGHPRVLVEVDEAYPNCRKYVQRRTLLLQGGSSPVARPRSDAVDPVAPRSGTSLEEGHRHWIREADTFFVASVHPERGADASHRGGEPGFVTFADERTLLVPDYPGNGLFNTLGNLTADPRAGILFADLERGRALQLTGRASLQWDLDRPASETGGTLRYWSVVVSRWVETALPTRRRWRLEERSPHNPPVGVGS